MNGDQWFVILTENDIPVAAIPWARWSMIPTSERPQNSYVVEAKDELDAFIKASKGG